MTDTIEKFERLHFKIQQGASFARTLTWRTGNPLAPVDLSSGYTARMSFRPTWGAPALFTLTEAAGLVLGSGIGNIQFEISETQAQLLTHDAPPVFDIRFVVPGGRVQRPFVGTTEIIPWVTLSA